MPQRSTRVPQGRRRRLPGVPRAVAAGVADALRARLVLAAVAVLSEPLSRSFGFDRGTPIDRIYLEAFLARHQADVRGRCMEVKSADYVRRYGADRVSAVDVVDIDPGNPAATLLADLNEVDSLPEGVYDCVVLTQVLQFLRPELALPALYRALAPGGVLLLSVPVLCRFETPGSDRSRLSAAGVEHSLGELLPDADVQVRQEGNLPVAVAFLVGLSAEEVGLQRLQPRDWRFPVITLARVQKPGSSPARPAAPP